MPRSRVAPLLRFRPSVGLILPFILLSSCLCAGQGRPGFKLLHSFGGSGDGDAPSSGVVFDTKGNLYGTTGAGGAYGYGTVYELSPQNDGTWTETILHSFPNPGSTQDGSEPSGGVAIDRKGNLYGTAESGGANSRGIIFELTPGDNGWAESILYNFCSLPGCTDGGSPGTAPVLDSAGSLYGGTNSGFGQGVVYELTPSGSGWEEDVLYTFCSQPDCTDGRFPGQVVMDRRGNIYGPTDEGGSDFGYCPLGCGVVFVLNPPNLDGGWTETVLHAFQGGTDGIGPNGITFYGGKIFGTTGLGGGSQDCTIGCGTVFAIAPGENGGAPQEEVLYAFSNFSGGQNPGGAPVFDKAGNMYGVAGFGGAPCGCGLVWELKRVTGGWQYKILHDFTGGDGVLPLGSLTIDSNGNLYGTTNGGSTGGVVFEILNASPTAK
ncbi:MAG TPA: choice-of-anchor tandem repeat GloVer-containing protein [Terriglobales bacterium]|nr:choice-of-anchor tandem repeat GloVer-containing protein [Terriglobales bacterium]